MINTVFLAGYGNSKDGHWQKEWYKITNNSHWVEQPDWDNPDCNQWVASLDSLIQSLDGPILLVTHSLGGSTLLAWCKKHHTTLKNNNIIGAFIVAPPDVDCDYFPQHITGYQNPSLMPLPFPSLLVASSDDPYASFERAAYFAQAWGCELINAGAIGHINLASGIEKWPEGKQLLTQFIESVAKGDSHKVNIFQD